MHREPRRIASPGQPEAARRVLQREQDAPRLHEGRAGGRRRSRDFGRSARGAHFALGLRGLPRPRRHRPHAGPLRAARRRVEDGHELLGVVALHDPPAASAAPAVANAREAGIDVRMLTGDGPDDRRRRRAKDAEGRSLESPHLGLDRLLRSSPRKPLHEAGAPNQPSREAVVEHGGRLDDHGAFAGMAFAGMAFAVIGDFGSAVASHWLADEPAVDARDDDATSAYRCRRSLSGWRSRTSSRGAERAAAGVSSLERCHRGLPPPLTGSLGGP